MPPDSQSRRPIWIIILGLAALFLIIAGSIAFNRYQAAHARARALHESQRADFAQCVAINDNRKSTRQLALINYRVLAERVRFDPPADTKLMDAWKRSLAEYQHLLDVQRSLNCETYVRPDLPPDSGIHSKP